MFRDKIREILELVLKAEEKNIYVAYNYDTGTKALAIITNTKVFGFEDNEYMEEWSEECIQYLKNLIGGENRMTEEERIREVEQISRRSRQISNESSVLFDLRAENWYLYRNAGRCHSKCKTNGRPLRTDRTHRIKKTHVTQIHEPG